ncbi:uncharacterized protein A1O9_00413 [Exophiala aquamarina CBS 119918]|uniref:DNA replication factor Cdt1 C-terminal domain-containing protein n=1 Tax=Exophiala aquamarina CBS 119918 TaxID=1182545 RepID=A0A072PRE3_9EURO|nr:uncharacterized protein A1O9_00413 [Exophiala aquamarina CBS 119918]KEF62441.1 hypothetical protein A1O9_00413 [Exophiala aquamarina CBS 119918]
MAPSTRAARVSKRQTPLRAFTKVSKATSQRITKALACEAFISPIVEVLPPTKNDAKRKRSLVGHDNETESEKPFLDVKTKKAKISLPSPPCSQSGEEILIDTEFSTPIHFAELSLSGKPTSNASPPQELPLVLQDLKSLHKSFLKAFTIHVAHNGPSAPADLCSLLSIVTRIWKKHAASREDIQRMLAIYEIGASTKVTSKTLKFRNSPFKLNMAGLGDNLRYHIEFCGTQLSSQSSYEEQKLQELYEQQLLDAFSAQKGQKTSWLCDEISLLPRLEFQMGVQTQLRREKASVARKHILGIAPANQRLAKPQPSVRETDQARSEENTHSQALKARTLSLFDRVRAKQLANSIASGPTPESILRSRAIGRIDDVVDILRMKQQQKLGSTLGSSLASPGKARSRVSFGMNQVIHDIKSSLSVPIADEEIRMSINILANDVAGGWLTTFNMGSVQTVILNGSGMSGFEIKRRLL